KQFGVDKLRWKMSIGQIEKYRRSPSVFGRLERARRLAEATHAQVWYGNKHLAHRRARCMSPVRACGTGARCRPMVVLVQMVVQ
ncbi:MAG: hypothetical protein WAL92_15510, partial [Thiogranum sp.]